LNRIIELFTSHPKAVGETYFQHQRCSAKYGLKMIFSGVAAIIHSIFPFLFETAASDCAKSINEQIESRTHKSQT
tara:strand:- start:861 stop:1085 length:225 start_codon:yes stop_codon:yes gene_type:complete